MQTHLLSKIMHQNLGLFKQLTETAKIDKSYRRPQLFINSATHNDKKVVA